MVSWLLYIIICVSILCIYLLVKVRYLSKEMRKTKQFLADSFSFDEEINVGDGIEFLEKKSVYENPQGFGYATVYKIENGKYYSEAPNGTLYVSKKENIRRHMEMTINRNLLYKIEYLWKDHRDKMKKEYLDNKK